MVVYLVESSQGLLPVSILRAGRVKEDLTPSLMPNSNRGHHRCYVVDLARDRRVLLRRLMLMFEGRRSHPGYLKL